MLVHRSAPKPDFMPPGLRYSPLHVLPRFAEPFPRAPPPMFFIAFVRRISLVAGLIVACATLAYAGRGGTGLEECGRARNATPPQPPRPVATTLSDDLPTLVRNSTLAASATTTHAEVGTSTPRSTLPLPFDHRNDKRERGRATPPSASLHVHRPITNRSKSAIRSTPATPGMGLLLRFGTSAGREISLNTDHLSHAPLALRPGRAPPRGSPCAAGSPELHPLARAVASGSTFAGRPTSTGALAFAHTATETFHRPWARALACRASDAGFAAGRPASGEELLHRSRASRLKGTAARPDTPFGGFTA